jgi:spore coat protein CotH
MNRNVCTVILILICACVDIRAQTAEDLFNSHVLREIRIDVHPRDWAALRQNFQLDTYYPADVHWLFDGRHVTVEQVGIRSRGLGSRNGIKPGLLLNFERYTGRRFLGLGSLVLRNNVQDASMLREHLGMTFMRAMGQAAPRTAFSRLFVNGEYWGLYTIVESIDEVFILSNFGQRGGYLYKYEYIVDAPPYFFEYRGPGPALYTPRPFKPENHEADLDPAALVAMIRTINQATDTEFVGSMSQYLNLQGLARYLALEAFIAEEDGVAGNWGLNNFYMYRFEGSNLFQLIPWDKSQVLNDFNRSIWTNLQTNVLIRRSLEVPEVRAAFVNALLESADFDIGAGGWLEREIERAYAQIRSAVLEDRKKLCYRPDFSLGPCSNEQFENSVVFMLQFARERTEAVRREVLGQ